MCVMRERMAAYAHEAWKGWVRYMFRFGTMNPDGTFTLYAETVALWRHDMAVTYGQLADERKTGFLAEADILLGAQRIEHEKAG
jgi:hypothetical protein